MDVKRVPIKKKESTGKVKLRPRKSSFAVTFISLLLIAGLIFGLLNSDKLGLDQFMPTGQVIAKVNGNPILSAELEKQYSQVPAMYRPFFTKQVILEQMISQEVLLLEAKKQKITIPKDEMDEIMDEAILKAGGTKEKFEEILAAQNTTTQDIRDMYEISLMIDRLITKEVIDLVSVSEEDIATYYEENKEYFYNNESTVRASHILITMDQRTAEEADAIITEIMNKIKEGEDFNDLAEVYSEDPSAKTNKGDLGYFPKSAMVEAFADVAFSMNIGDISEPVESSFGLHIIKKVDQKEPGYLELEDVSSSIKQTLLQEIQQEKVQEYITKLREAYNIEYYGEFNLEEMKEELGVETESLESEAGMNEAEDVTSETDINSAESDSTVEEEVANVEEDLEETTEELAEVESDMEDAETESEETEELEAEVEDTTEVIVNATEDNPEEATA